MTKLDTLAYLKLNKWQKFLYNLKCFFIGIPGWFADKFKKIGRFFKKLGLKIADNFVDLWNTFKYGSWSTRGSYLVMGLGSFRHKQWLRGILFFLMEAAFIVYMALAGGHWLGLFGTLGKTSMGEKQEWNEWLGEYITVKVDGDNSFKILLYGILTLFFIIALIYTWRLNIKQNRINDEICGVVKRKKQWCRLVKKYSSCGEKAEAAVKVERLKQLRKAVGQFCKEDEDCNKILGKKIKSTKDDLKAMVDDEFHKTMLSLPVAGIVMFTVLPIIFMILVAFTNYDKDHNGYTNLFTWVGLDNFNSILTFGNGISVAFGEILAWTLIWAFFATFSNYFLGMLVAMMINKKGIKIKKFWRTVLVISIAVPQFISLLYISNMFADNGLVNSWLMKIGLINDPIQFWGNGTLAKVMVIIINIWVGIPYLMLITTGILMNIPADLYESAKIDGANPFQQFCKITLPYMLFVTGPYLLTSFVGNINNFNVIYLLTQGGPSNPIWGDAGGYVAGDTTILITWLFGITTGSESNYKMASVIGILIFAVVSILSLIVFSVMPSNKREDDYS